MGSDVGSPARKQGMSAWASSRSVTPPRTVAAAGPYLFSGPLVSYALARFSPGPVTFQARRLYPALPACARGQAAIRPRLAARDQVRRLSGDCPRLWARTTSDYSNTFTRIRDARPARSVPTVSFRLPQRSRSDCDLVGEGALSG